MDAPTVALVCHEYPPYHIGGVGTYARDLSIMLSENRIHTTVFCGKSWSPKEEKINDYLRIVRLPILDVPLRAYWFQIMNYSGLRKRLGQYDVVHALSPQSAAICAICKRRDQPLVTTVHNVPVFLTKAFFNSSTSEWTTQDLISNFIELPINSGLYRLCLSKSKYVVTLSRHVLIELETAYGPIAEGKARVISNGIDFERIRRLKDELGSTDFTANNQILFFGRLVTAKGLQTLLSAMSILKNRFPSVKLKIVGTGPLYPRLRSTVSKCGLSGNVDFVGYLSTEALLHVIMRSTLVVVPSTYEAQPLALLEAMACSKPVVAPNLPFANEVISDQRTGLLANPSDPTNFADKITSLICDENLRKTLGMMAFDFVRSKYDWTKIVEKYIELYRSVSAEG